MFLYKFIRITLATITCGASFAPPALSQVRDRPLPVKEVLPLSPDTFCEGMTNVFAISKQEIREQVQILCNDNGTATETFKQAIATAYQGGANDRMQELRRASISLPEGPSVELLYVQGMRVQKTAAQALLIQEKYITIPYEATANPGNGTIKSVQSFVSPPPVNLNFADTSFAVQQELDVNVPGRDVVFKDTSLHDLRLYLVHPNNFDYFMAARTLQAKSEQFRSAVIVRAVMTDPADPQYSYTVSVLHFKMNDRGRAAGIMDNVENLMRGDLRLLYESLTK